MVDRFGWASAVAAAAVSAFDALFAETGWAVCPAHCDVTDESEDAWEFVGSEGRAGDGFFHDCYLTVQHFDCVAQGYFV